MTNASTDRYIATLRALSGQPDLYFRAGRLYSTQQQEALAFYAPHVQFDPNATLDALHLRGLSDALSLRLLHGDPAIYQQYQPEAAFAALVYELLEQLRVETLVPIERPGMRYNLKQHFYHWAQHVHQSGLTEEAVGLLLFTLANISRFHLSGEAIPEEFAEPMEATRAGIAPIIGAYWPILRQQRNNPARFAPIAQALAEAVQVMLDESMQQQKSDSRQTVRQRQQQTLWRIQLSAYPDEQGFATLERGRSRIFSASGERYRIFTQAYDKQLNATQLARPALLTELRAELDQATQAANLNRLRLMHLLQTVLAHPQQDDWTFGLDEGYLDGRRLAQLVASPSQQAVFKQEATPPISHATVTFLLDCSGSMKTHGKALATLLDIMGQSLERAGVPCELLGFTTTTWHGGPVLREWRQNGQPTAPGRLNATQHIVFKAAEQRWRKTRLGLAALLKQDWYRESVDGEAVQWAAQRLRQQESTRRLLVVLSDGCPMDTATRDANDLHYLDHHLQQVVNQLEQYSDIELYGLGVGLDLSQYYRHHLAIDLSKGIDNRLLAEIVNLWRKN